MQKYSKNPSPANQFTKENAAEFGRRGALKTNAKKKIQKEIMTDIKAVVGMILNTPIEKLRGPDGVKERFTALLDAAGVPETERNARALFIANIFMQAMTSKGVRWAELFARMSGEEPIPQSDINVLQQSVGHVEIIQLPDNHRDKPSKPVTPVETVE